MVEKYSSSKLAGRKFSKSGPRQIRKNSITLQYFANQSQSLLKIITDIFMYI